MLNSYDILFYVRLPYFDTQNEDLLPKRYILKICIKILGGNTPKCFPLDVGFVSDF